MCCIHVPQLKHTRKRTFFLSIQGLLHPIQGTLFWFFFLGYMGAKAKKTSKTLLLTHTLYPLPVTRYPLPTKSQNPPTHPNYLTKRKHPLCALSLRHEVDDVDMTISEHFRRAIRYRFSHFKEWSLIMFFCNFYLFWFLAMHVCGILSISFFLFIQIHNRFPWCVSSNESI